jgi:hypothetical protein
VALDETGAFWEQSIMSELSNDQAVNVTNPWEGRVPSTPPFVLPEDAAAVNAFNHKPRLNPDFFLHVDLILPEPFAGDRYAPVVLLSNNPGVTPATAPNRQGQAYMNLVRANLAHDPTLPVPFIFMAPECGRESREWWRKRLRWLIEDCGEEAVVRNILNVVAFPYPSGRYNHARVDLQSQARRYALQLVREAMHREAVIIRMRNRKQDPFLQGLPELKTYPHVYTVRNSQKPFISPGNCPEGLAAAVRAIRAREVIKKASGK